MFLPSEPQAVTSDFNLKREALARYGLSVDEANMAVMSAIGGENVTTTIEGRERYSQRALPARLPQLGR